MHRLPHPEVYMKHRTLEANFAMTLRPGEAKDVQQLETYYLWSGWKKHHWPADIIQPGLRLYGFDTESRRFCVLLEIIKGGSFIYRTLKEFAYKVDKLTDWPPRQDDPHWSRLPTAQAGKYCTGIAIRW